MSRRTAIVEDFDDDTDIPLPSRPLPNTGKRGAIIEQIGASDDDADDDDDDDMSDLMPQAGPASPSQAAFMKAQAQMRAGTVPAMDMTPYKNWTCIYPIYLDAKRPYGTGTRRIARSKAVWWPQARDIAEALSRLQLRSLLEPDKSHPQDWENPGRVRVQWKKDGRLVNSSIKTKKQLLETIASQIQRAKPDYVPREPYTYTSPSVAPASILALPAPSAKSKSKGKQAAGKPASAPTPVVEPTKASAEAPSAADRKTNGRLAQPPAPLPPLATRVSPYSPALPAGMLVETVKAGMSAAAQEPAGGAPGGSPAGMKGKRKVVRVRQ